MAAALLVAALMCFAAVPMESFAAEVTVEEGQGSAPVSLLLDREEGARKGATSLELGLKITSENPEGMQVSFDFSESLKTGRVAEFRYHADTGILNLYVAGETPLFAESAETLLLGQVVAEGNAVRVNVVENSLKLSGNGVVEEEISLQTLAEDVPITDGDVPGPVDRSKLQEILVKVAEYKADDYTPESYAILAEAVKTAEAVLGKADATQEEIDEAVLLVENAIGSLVEKQNVIGGNQPPASTDQNGTGSGPSGSQGQQKPGTNSTGKGADTGDKTTILPYVILAMASIAAIGGVLIMQRRKSGRKGRPEK